MDTTLVALAVVAVVAWFWSDSLRAREQALMAGQRACREMDVQMLDQTVALAAIALRRDGAGRLRLLRRFGFEFSIDGAARQEANVVLLGRSLELVEMMFPRGRVLLDAHCQPLDTVH